jgi:hypothetical protein
MLTASQCEIVAFVTDGGIICHDCAVSRFGEMGVAALEEGLAEFLPQDVSPLIRYELDSFQGEDLWERCREDTETDEEAQELFDSRSDEGYPCDECGQEID